MSQPAVVPIPPDLTARYTRSSAGRAWLASLPDLIQGRLDNWQLTPDLRPGALPWNGHGGIVIPVRQQDGSPAALKIAFPHDEARVERHALALWQGQGAVALLASHAGTCAMLLERLDGERSLATVPMEEAVVVWAGLVRQLSVTPDDRPEWFEFEHIAARAEQWSDDLPADWEQLGRPFPRWLLEAALEVCQTRGAVGRRSARDVLVHTDLHYLNVLARPAGPGRHALPTAAGYAAIDPQPMIGDPEFAVAPLLWNRLSDLPLDNPAAGLRRRCAGFSSAAGLDPEVARQWGIAREVANALGYAGKPDHRGDLARSLWVASTLAGRTLDGLPPAHRLPEPGEAVGAR
ncbi:streptomycin 6-kinase [Pseudarthrobacter sp. W1I19]|uniref:aminoglycoside phosphotransferase family protein n=1 Tax=Pseudarthrobacter sp. W1I19 TaxID=3042288 RepID=UPI002782935A|nr:aminoglycoside phosphotransferase family protein [Pseudarthrobacter sp. W1I19]MDQ0924177.1 streptomycin 6-kinase [Pseudarthrobacter sp. W1I19]